MTEEELQDREDVWRRMAEEFPEFTRAHDLANNYHAVREIVLGGSSAWAAANGFFKPMRGKKVMDIGANAGIYTAYCALHGADVTAYEPHPKLYPQLSDMLISTGLLHVRAVQAAVWTFTGWASFIDHTSPLDGFTRYNGGVKSNGIGWTQNEVDQAKTTRCISFEQAIGSEMWDCVKMDIEGAEFEVLLATPVPVLRQIKFMYVEFHPWASPEIYEQTIDKLRRVFRFVGAFPNALGRWEVGYLFQKG